MPFTSKLKSAVFLPQNQRCTQLWWNWTLSALYLIYSSTITSWYLQTSSNCCILFSLPISSKRRPNWRWNHPNGHNRWGCESDRHSGSCCSLLFPRSPKTFPKCLSAISRVFRTILPSTKKDSMLLSTSSTISSKFIQSSFPSSLLLILSVLETLWTTDLLEVLLHQLEKSTASDLSLHCSELLFSLISYKDKVDSIASKPVSSPFLIESVGLDRVVRRFAVAVAIARPRIAEWKRDSRESFQHSLPSFGDSTTAF